MEDGVVDVGPIGLFFFFALVGEEFVESCGE